MLSQNQNKEKVIPDTELVELYRNRARLNYVTALFERYSYLIYGVCLDHLKNETDSKDAAMEVFEAMIRELRRHSVEDFKPWLYALTQTLCHRKLES